MISYTCFSRHVPLGLCLLLLFHGCLAQLMPLQKQQQSPCLSGRSECQIDRITAREPNRVLISEAGVSEFWDSFENDELECAGVEAVRHTINPKGLLLPYYPSAPELVYVIRGRGLQGTVLPGCPETFETSFASEGGREQFSDKHQRVYRYKEGDILALPAGTVHWTYNDGDTPIVTIVLRDISNVANQLDRNFRNFFLAGNPHSQHVQQGGHWEQPGRRPSWQQPGQQGPSGSPHGSSWKPSQQGPSWQQPGQQGTWGSQPGQQRPSGSQQDPSWQQPGQQTPSGSQQGPSGQQPGQQQPSGSHPGHKRPSGSQEGPSWQQPGEQQPSESQPVQKRPSGSQQVPSWQQPGQQQPSESKPGQKRPSGSQQGPSWQQPDQQQPSESKPGQKRPSESQQGPSWQQSGQQPEGSQPGQQRPSGSQQDPSWQEPGQQRPSRSHPGQQRPSGSQQGPSWQQPGQQGSSGSQLPSEQPAQQDPKGSYRPSWQHPGQQGPSRRPWGSQSPSGKHDQQEPSGTYRPSSEYPSQQDPSGSQQPGQQDPWGSHQGPSWRPGHQGSSESQQGSSWQPGHQGSPGSRIPSEEQYGHQDPSGSYHPSWQHPGQQGPSGTERPGKSGKEQGKPSYKPSEPTREDPCEICRRIKGESWEAEPCANYNDWGRQEEQRQEGYNIFSGFDDIILEEIFKVTYDTVRKLKGANDDRGLIVRAENFEVPVPEEQEGDKSSYGGRGGSGRDNGIEQTLCSTQLSANIASPARADVYNPRGGRISSLNSHQLPVLNLLQLSAERGVLYKNAILSPHYNLNAHSIIYVTSGSSRLQIVRNNGSTVFDDFVEEGQLIVVPQDFAVIKKAGEEGCEWVAFKTTNNAITTQLAGHFSFIRALPEEVLVNSYDISREQAKSLKYNRQEGVVLSPRSESTMKKAKNALLNAFFG